MSQCTAVADDLLIYLNKLTFDGLPDKWQTIRLTLRTVLSNGKIKELSNRLNILRSELALRILALLNAKSDIQASQLAETVEQLRRSGKDVVEVVSLESNSLKRDWTHLATRFEDLLERGEESAQQRHLETVAAILTLRDGDTKIVTRPLNNNETSPGCCKLRTLTVKEGKEISLRGGSHDSPQFSLNDFEPVQKRILDCLYFRQITDRVEEVAPAHRRTFEWIFRDPVPIQKPWSDFKRWLTQGQGCYWIGGKAGSGKSTLMKYIHGDERTKIALRTWAGERELVTASFFFWNLGSELQRSHKGLLRSLLFDILAQRPYLIPTTLPGLCRTALADSTAQLSEPSFAELNKAFFNLLEQHSNLLRICLFIDGIDEYDGDHADLIEVLVSLSSSTAIKIILSSRPIPACVEAFSKYASLRLQDLTYDDIHFYVEDKLGRHPNMERLKSRSPTAAILLVSEICSKASGVFLWVKLVVRSLLQGFCNHDRISDLRRRLEELPTDLAKLYEHMLESMIPLYRQQASQLFQIVMAHLDADTEQPLTLLQLSYAEEDPTEAITIPMHHPEQKEEDFRCDEIEMHLRSRCCGLIEVQDRHTSEQRSSLSTIPCVGFLHRTVVEFLRLDSNWTGIVNLTNGTSFNPMISLLSSCLYLLKTGRQPTLRRESKQLWSFCRNFLLFARLAEQTIKKPQTAFLDEFDNTMTMSWKMVDMHGDDPWTVHAGFEESFMVLATKCGLVLYVSEKLDQSPTLARGNSGSFLLGYTLSRLKLPDRRDPPKLTQQRLAKKETFELNPLLPASVYVALFQIFLQHGADPNHEAEAIASPTACVNSPWTQALHIAHSAVYYQHSKALNEFGPGSDGEAFATIIRLLVIHGADPNAYTVCNADCRSALATLESLFDPSSCKGEGGRRCEEILDLLRARGAFKRYGLAATRKKPPTETPRRFRQRPHFTGFATREGRRNVF